MRGDTENAFPGLLRRRLRIHQGRRRTLQVKGLSLQRKTQKKLGSNTLAVIHLSSKLGDVKKV